jgi:hypothetical protein
MCNLEIELRRRTLAVQSSKIELVNVDDTNGRVWDAQPVSDGLATQSNVNDEIHGASGTSDVYEHEHAGFENIWNACKRCVLKRCRGAAN